MASRQFAYNPTQSIISGTTNIGTLCVGDSPLDYSSNPGGLTWWMGPEENNLFIVAKDVPEENFPTPIGNIGGVQFWSCPNNDSAFIQLVSMISGSTKSTITEANNWISSNNYWTNWTQTYSAGLFKTTYAGYFDNITDWFLTATPTTYGSNPDTSVQTTAITEASSNDGEQFSCEWLGYFKPTTTEIYTFYLSSDDGSYMWLGENAQSGYIVTNVTVGNGGVHSVQEASGSASLTAGVYYPIRIQFGEFTGGDTLTFSFSTPTIPKTTNVTGLVFYNPSTNGF
jgi:hypothetical protein